MWGFASQYVPESLAIASTLWRIIPIAKNSDPMMPMHADISRMMAAADILDLTLVKGRVLARLTERSERFEPVVMRYLDTQKISDTSSPEDSCQFSRT